MALQRVSMLHFSLKQWGVRCCSCWRHLLAKVGRTTKRFFNFRHHDLWLACIVSKFFFFLSLIFWLMNNNHSKTIFRIKCKILYLAIITHSSDGLLRHYIVDKLRRLRSAKCFWIVSTKEKKNTLNDVFSTDFRICATLQMVLSRNFCSAPKKMILHASKQKYEKSSMRGRALNSPRLFYWCRTDRLSFFPRATYVCT